MRSAGVAIAAGSIVALTLASSAALAQSDADAAAFYRSHPITIEVGYNPASAYDMLGRTVGRHLGRHIPGNPSVIIVNQPGAGSLTTANRFFNVTKRDGTDIAHFGRSIFMEPLLGNKQAQFDPTRYSWIGNVADETSVCVSWHQSKIKKWDDLFEYPFIAGANSASSDTGVFANLIKEVFGAKIKLVMGYPGGAEITRAIESGEVDGRCGWSWSAVVSSRPNWIADKMINVLVQLGLNSHPQLKDVPVLPDLTKTPAQRDIVTLVLRRQEVAWPFVAPPGIPPDRLMVLRRAFDRTMADPDFIREAAKLGIEVRPTSGQAVEEIVRSVYQSSPQVVDQVRKLLNP